MGATATLRFLYDADSWDHFILLIHDSASASIVHLNDHGTCLNLNFDLIVAYDAEHSGDLIVDIDGNKYQWSESV